MMAGESAPSITCRRDLEAAIEELEELYAQLPAVSCLGLCEASCGEHIDASTPNAAASWTPASTWTPPHPTEPARR